MATLDRLRALPPRLLAVGAGLVAIVLLAVVAIVASGDGSGDVATAEPTTVTATTVAETGTTTTTQPGPPTTARTTTVRATTTTIDLSDEYEIEVDPDDPAIAARPIPEEPTDEPPPTTIAPPPWAASTRITPAGYVATDVGCAADTGSVSLDWFFASRVGPVIGWDYQHVYPLGGDRYLWLFQDAFIDHSGTATTLGASRFAHNAALLQEGACFTLLHRGSPAKPAPFEIGDGTGDVRTKWWWPMGGELVGDQVWVFWAEMVKDAYDPLPPDGLGWHPYRVYLASYDTTTLERTSFVLAPDPSPTPIYGYAVASDATHTYLFGNTFEQNLVREGGFWNGPHSATRMWLARVPRGQLASRPEYRTADGWSSNRADAVPIVERFWVENPMQPRYLDGQWVSSTAVDGYWGDSIAIDMAEHPWGPWVNVQFSPLLPRNADPKMNTYHAHLLPWRDGFGSLLISVSNNARNMLRDAWPAPHRYRPTFIYSLYRETPPPATTTTTTTTTTTSTTSTTTSTTTVPATTVPRTTVPRTTTSSTSSSTSSTSSTTTSSTTSTTVAAPTPTAGDG